MPEAAMTSSYIIKGGEAGRARLSVLSEAMAEATGSLLDRAGAWDGRRALDAGCGGGDVSRDLARRVGPSGQVVGIDADGAKIAAARDAAADLPRLSFRAGDAIAAGPGGPFDVIYVRFLLSHLTDPVGALATLHGRLKPGGLLVAEDVDFDGHFAEPAQPALDRYVAWYKAAAWRRGANAILGRGLPPGPGPPPPPPAPPRRAPPRGCACGFGGGPPPPPRRGPPQSAAPPGAAT